MLVRTYSGRTVQEALSKVRAHLGDGALIIETRPVKEPGLFGRAVGYEVVAASDDSDDEPRRQTTAAGITLSSVGAEPEFTGRSYSQASVAQVQPAAQTAIDQELATIRRQLTRLAAGQGTPTGHLGEDLARELEDRELPAEIVAELDEAVGRAGPRLDPSQRRAFCASVLARGLDKVTTIDWNACRRLLVVGPTGVGKTTTIAKLAGDLVLKQKRKVALITIDTYRVGATDQLKAYADLLDIPVEIAATPAQLAESLRRFADADHVLIDTAGRSPADAARVHELKGFCRCAPGITVMLACAANAGRAEFAAVVERFSILPIELAAVTKLDECAAPGRLYGCLRRHRLPVSVVTTGQEVPADISAASPQDLSMRVVETAVMAVA